MSVDLRVLSLGDQSEVYDFAQKQDEFRGGDLFSGWTAPWRKESLEHYLKTGWCLGAFEREGSLRGFVLAQPVLFWRRQTQAVWVEYLDAGAESVAFELAEAIVRIGRDKHMQRVIFAELFGHLKGGRPEWSETTRQHLVSVFGKQVVNSEGDERKLSFELEVKTTKVSD